MELKDIVHQGWLYKQSRYFKTWKRYINYLFSSRWVVMSKTHLYTYKSQDMRSKPTEAILLRICRGVKSAEDFTKKPFSFQIDLGHFVFYFHAETNEQKEKWIGVISKVP